MKKIIILALALTACRNTPTAPPRVHFPSTISATKCASGKYSVTTKWQATGTWKALFVDIDKSVTEASPVNDSQTKTSSCLFISGDRVYTILYPVTVQSDGDLSPTIVIQ